MGNDWINNLLKERLENRESERRQEKLTMMAQSHATEMFRRLCMQIESDASRYSEGSGVAIYCEFKDGSQFEVSNGNRIPAFRMSLTIGPIGFITISVEQTMRKSSSAKDYQVPSLIDLIAKGQDAVYYRLNGDDFVSECDVSQRLLGPLLKFAESQ